MKNQNRRRKKELSVKKKKNLKNKILIGGYLIAQLNVNYIFENIQNKNNQSFKNNNISLEDIFFLFSLLPVSI